MEKFPDKIDSKFRFVLLAAHRAEQLLRGAQPKLEKPTGKLTSIAMKEVTKDALTWDYGPEPAPEEPVLDEAGEENEAEPVKV